METNEKKQLKRAYSILHDPNGDLLLMIEAQEGEPDIPLLIYDGHDTALLCRTFVSCVKLNHIAEDAREHLLAANQIFIAETQGTEIVRDYYASVKIVPNVQNLIAL